MSSLLMAESDGGEANPGAGPRAGGDASPDPPRPPRPQLTKSRTISGSAASASDRGGGGARDNILVRRSSTAPLPPAAVTAPRRLTVAVDDPSYAAAQNGGVLDRDWCYPSFLGPHASRPRPTRQQQQTPAAAADRRNPNPTLPRRVAVSQREEEMCLASVVKQSALLEERRPLAPPPPPPPPRAPRFDLSPYLLLVSEATCNSTDVLVWSISHPMSSLLQLLVVTVTSTSMAFWQWMKVLGLQVIYLICENYVLLIGSRQNSFR